jgi:hypothetical protein
MATAPGIAWILLGLLLLTPALVVGVWIAEEYAVGLDRSYWNAGLIASALGLVSIAIGPSLMSRSSRRR